MILRAQEVLTRWQKMQGERANPLLRDWAGLLERGLEAALEAALDEGPRGEAMRKCSPLAVLLFRKERFAFLRYWNDLMQQEQESQARSPKVSPSEPVQEALVLLKVLALREREVAAGKLRSVEDVIKRLREKAAADMQERRIDSDRAPGLLELQCIAEATFGSAEAASGWLRRAHPMLNGESPIDWVTSVDRAARVKEILIALKYGGAA